VQRTGKKTGKSPVDRRKTGSKHHLIVDAHGVPLASILTGANRHDVTQLLSLVASIPPIRGKVGPPLRKPERVMGDRADDPRAHRMALSCRAIATEIARRNTPHGSGLGVFRWFVEQSLALMHQFKRLRTRDDRDDHVHEAFMLLASTIMCWRRLHSGRSFF
jgi:transposase